jgi:hypothetical protein
MTSKINKKVAYETLNQYLGMSKEFFTTLDDDNLEILLNFVSNQLINKNK